jgi:hypothetical protein
MKTLLDKLREDLAAQDVRPIWMGPDEPGPRLHPFCDADNCPQHGRRVCKKTGHRPSDHCDVAVAAMAELLVNLFFAPTDKEWRLRQGRLSRRL